MDDLNEVSATVVSTKALLAETQQMIGSMLANNDPITNASCTYIIVGMGKAIFAIFIETPPNQL